MKTFLAAAAVTLAALPASAAITFDLTGPVGTFNQPLVLTADDSVTTVAVTAFRNFTSPANTRITRDATGLGVSGPFDTDKDLDSQIYETITFTFSTMVKLGTVLFSDFDSDDDYEIFVDGVAQPGIGLTANPYAFGWIAANSFTVQAKKINDGFLDFDDSFRIQQIQVAAVPLPPAGFVLLSALGGVAVAYRRRKAA